MLPYPNLLGNLLIPNRRPAGLNINMQADIIPLPAANQPTIEELEAIFTRALLSIKMFCLETLGEDKIIASVAIPPQFKCGSDTKKAIVAAGKNVLGLIDTFQQSRSLTYVVRLHYELTECHEEETARSWLETDHCAMLSYNDESQKEFQFMFVEYKKDYLRAKIVEIDRGIEDTLSEQLWMFLGESGYNSSSVGKSYSLQ
jgi:hypothetical protein